MKKNYLVLTMLLVFAMVFSITMQAQIIYGTTQYGGAHNAGVLFKYTSTPNLVSVVDFGIPGGFKTISTAMHPQGNLLHSSDGMIYGVTAWGGSLGEGAMYVYNPIADTIGLINSFGYSDGSPEGGLIQTSSGAIYGNSASGGINYLGVLFKYIPSTLSFSVFYQLTTVEGGGSTGGMTYHSDGFIYFVTSHSASYSKGAIIRIDPSNDGVLNKFNLDSIYGYEIFGSMCSASNGKLYGLAQRGGANDVGTLFEFDPITDTVSVLFDFHNTVGASSTGHSPKASPVCYNGKLYGVTQRGGLYNKGAIFEYNITTSQYTKIMDFDSTITGALPIGKFTIGNDGWLYGSCGQGGAFDMGTFYKFNPISHTFIRLIDFNGLNGQSPVMGGGIETVDLQFSASDTILTTPPFNIQFTNQTPNSSNYIWQWQFGDGSFSYQQNPSHTYTNNGTYTVTLIANDTVNNRQDTLMKQYYLELSGAAPCPVTASVSPSGFINICPGDSVKLSSVNKDQANSYQWLRTGLYLTGATDTVYWAKQTGYYQVRVDNGTCWNFSNVAYVNLYPTQPPIIEENGYIAPCSNDSLKLFIYGKTYSSYLWSTGETTSTIWVKESGFYTLTIGDNNGCPVTSPIDTVNAALVEAPSICIVGVDSVSGHNMIVWNQSTNLEIDSFRVYKEGSINNKFHLIGQKGRTETAMLVDANSDPRVTSYRYRLMAVDSCGSETPIGPYHRTIHLMVNIGQTGTWNLYWNPYEGANIGTYHIYRGTDSTQMQLLASVPSSAHSFTDGNPPTGDVFYLLKVDLPNACNPGGGISYNLSSSNFFNTKDATVGVEEIQMHDISLSVFPNPNNGQFTITINSETQKRINIMVFNNLGSVIATDQIDVNGKISKNIDLSHLSKGIYYLRLQTSDDVVMRKVIIQ
ncbi:MAG: hypothetical protein DRI84_06420 [Bacteroidetes bacterium]|nr:MAG: hypothetical protein DRI84_06420 [Bacteroidota bacterium]